MEPDWLKTAREKGLRITEGPTAKPTQLPTARVSPQLASRLTERQFQEIVVSFAQGRGWRVGHFRKVRVARTGGKTFWETPVAADGKGFPDLELVRDRLIKAELKVGKNKLEPDQELWRDAYLKAGIEWYCWYPRDLADIYKILW